MTHTPLPPPPPGPHATIALTLHIPTYVWVALTAACMAIAWAAVMVADEWTAASYVRREGLGEPATAGVYFERVNRDRARLDSVLSTYDLEPRPGR